jgi:pyridoxamine 5'-phosphate oxidase
MVSDPGPTLAEWLDDARLNAGVENWNAMMLATVGDDGRPSVRTVLLKSFDPEVVALTFFTNYASRKADEIAANPHVALAMHWDRLERQVRIEGVAERVSDEESDAYFSTRPRLHQIGAWASDQSRTLDSAAALARRVAAAGARYVGRRIPRPPHWGGYRVAADRVELWKAGQARVHRRMCFEREANGWASRLLFP